MGIGLRIDPKAAWVSVILRELGVPISVGSKGARIAMQKAVYLAQTRGADLGYRFSWYLNGPYSSSLADTYYLIDEDPAPYEGYSANQEFKDQLAAVKQLIESKPAQANLSDWLEAVGSLDFMVRVMARPLADAIKRCKDDKPHLAALFEPAREALITHGFQNAT